MDTTELFRSLLAKGETRDAALAELRKTGASPMESICAIAVVECVGPVEAKRLFAQSRAWSDYTRQNDDSLLKEALSLEAIGQSLQYILRSGQFSGEFETRMGVTKAAVEQVVAAWPLVDDRSDDSSACLVINNALNEVCHGLRITESDWSRWFTVSRADVSEAYEQWVAARGWTSRGSL